MAPLAPATARNTRSLMAPSSRVGIDRREQLRALRIDEIGDEPRQRREHEDAAEDEEDRAVGDAAGLRLEHDAGRGESALADAEPARREGQAVGDHRINAGDAILD